LVNHIGGFWPLPSFWALLGGRINLGPFLGFTWDTGFPLLKEFPFFKQGTVIPKANQKIPWVTFSDARSFSRDSNFSLIGELTGRKKFCTYSFEAPLLTLPILIRFGERWIPLVELPFSNYRTLGRISKPIISSPGIFTPLLRALF